jgi:D-aminopeptidase
MPEGAFRSMEMGSIIVILATDAPLSPLSLRHIARRAAIGLGRGGTPGGNSSGDIFLAFSTADAGPMPQEAPLLLTRQELNPEHLDPLYLAAVEAVEESVVNALVAGEDAPTVKPQGHTVRAIDTNRLRALFA